VVACELAASSAGLTSQPIAVALDALRAASVPDSIIRQQLESLAAELDDEYLRLDEDGDPSHKSEALRLFSMARATSALAFALSDDDAQLHESIYEAVTAMDDPGELVRLVDDALR
jgi:hypothetical protein